MIELAGFLTGVLVALWSTSRLHSEAERFVRRRHAHVLEAFGSAMARLVLAGVIAWVLLTFSVAAALAMIAGFWVARTAYIGAIVLANRQLAS